MRYRVVVGFAVAGALALAPATAAATADFTATPGAGFQSWTINGQTSPTLNLVRGQTYGFDVEAPGHPFYIKTAPGAGTANQWTEGVTNQGQVSGNLTTFTVPADAPATLFYQCSVHAAMTGSIAITSPPPVPAGGAFARAVVVASLGGLGFMALGRLRRALARVRLTA
jgi:hypothetical protein